MIDSTSPSSGNILNSSLFVFRSICKTPKRHLFSSLFRNEILPAVSPIYRLLLNSHGVDGRGWELGMILFFKCISFCVLPHPCHHTHSWKSQESFWGRGFLVSFRKLTFSAPHVRVLIIAFGSMCVPDIGLRSCWTF